MIQKEGEPMNNGRKTIKALRQELADLRETYENELMRHDW